MKIQFIVPCVPVAQPRQRHAALLDKHGQIKIHNYTPGTAPVQTYKQHVQAVFRQHYQGPPSLHGILLTLEFVFPRPKKLCWKRRPLLRIPHTVRPDRDNLEKAVMDALNNLAYFDDGQVCGGAVSKWYAAGHEEPHTLITIEEVYLD